MKFKRPKIGWWPEVWLHNKMYYAYAVHSNGKVEDSAIKDDINDAVLSADELSNMLNLYHKYAGAYEGKVVRVGVEVDPDKIAEILYRWTEASKILLNSHPNKARREQLLKKIDRKLRTKFEK